MKAKVLMVVAMVIGVVTNVNSQGKIYPPKELDKHFRNILKENTFPSLPDSIVNGSWDSVYSKFDNYSYMRKLSNVEKEKMSWWKQSKLPANKQIMLGVGYMDCKILDITDKSPAFKGGLCVGDSIISINNNSINGNNKKIQEVLGNIPEFDTVSMTIKRGNNLLHFLMVRDTCTLDNMFVRRFSKTIYVKISEFGYEVESEFDEKVGNVGYHGIDSIIIDLRDNTGGLLWETIGILKKFCPEGDTIIKIVTRKDTTVVISDNFSHPLLKIKNIIILVNDQTASASELLTGCLKIRRNAKIYGSRTFGKGIIQHDYRYHDYSLMLTMGEYFAGGVMKVHKIGIYPDSPVPHWMTYIKNDKPIDNVDLAEIRRKYPNPTKDIIDVYRINWSYAYYIWGDKVFVFY